MLRETLVEAGVPTDRIQVIPDEQQAVDAALRMAKPGDLLLVFADAITRSWKQIIHFRPDVSEAPVPAPAPVAVEAPQVPAVALGDQDLLIRDERGVRLARETDD